MNPSQTITRFYQAFQQRDYATMQALYADDAAFTDEAFINLSATEVRAMWQMLITRGKDLQLTFDNVTETPTIGNATWVATYTFSATGRKVTNHITANFILENGKIKQHTDSFNFYKWSSQAFGIKGVLLGWLPFFKRKVQQVAKANLEVFMSKNIV